jgi:methionine-rich copper-binding protein CopC
MRAATLAAVAIFATLLLLQARPASAKPELTHSFPEDGDVLAGPPANIQLCFAGPINTKDKDKGGDFDFTILPPDGIPLGYRTIFQSDGFGLVVQPGEPEGDAEGEWTFTWRVTDAETLDPAEGTITFTVGPEGTPVPEGQPARCTRGGGPAASPTAGATLTPTAEAPGGQGGDHGDQNIPRMALITVGIAAAAAVSGLFFYVVRQRIGFWMHRPPEPGDGPGPDGEH